MQHNTILILMNVGICRGSLGEREIQATALLRVLCWQCRCNDRGGDVSWPGARSPKVLKPKP